MGKCDCPSLEAAVTFFLTCMSDSEASNSNVASVQF